MNAEQPSRASQASNLPRVQVSLTLMLLLMVVFAVLSAGLFYASQVPVLRQEVSMLMTGKSEGSGEDVGRVAHRAFIMFTFSSPLLVACVISLVVGVLKRFDRVSS
ncbi:MAG: hypothetical protein AAFU85_32175 [Planctomycetota bacterium]